MKKTRRKPRVYIPIATMSPSTMELRVKNKEIIREVEEVSKNKRRKLSNIFKK